MKPVIVSIEGVVSVTPMYFCEQLLNLERWKEFTGYSFLPGIREARFLEQREGGVGTRVQVINMDNSTHVEEFTKWHPNEMIEIHMSEFSKPLSHMVSHFQEEFRFEIVENGTKVNRTMKMYPRNGIGKCFLLFLAPIMRKALEQQAQIPY